MCMLWYIMECHTPDRALYMKNMEEGWAGNSDDLFHNKKKIFM